MAKPSTLTPGDSLSMAADILKLLTPVLKDTDKGKVARLKRDAHIVQETFRRLLDNQPLVKDYGDPDIPAFIRYVNNTGIVFNPKILFVVSVEQINTDALAVTILAKDTKAQRFLEWEHEFNTLIAPRRRDMAYTTLHSIEKTQNDPYLCIQEHIIAEKGSLTFFGNENIGYKIHIDCGEYESIEDISDYEIDTYFKK